MFTQSESCQNTPLAIPKITKIHSKIRRYQKMSSLLDGYFEKPGWKKNLRVKFSTEQAMNEKTTKFGKNSSRRFWENSIWNLDIEHLQNLQISTKNIEIFEKFQLFGILTLKKNPHFWSALSPSSDGVRSSLYPESSYPEWMISAETTIIIIQQKWYTNFGQF